MLKYIPFHSLYLADHGWLQSRFHFSFAEYHNPNNINFGPMRVMNDDLIAAHQGFGKHPHKDMEIISYIIDGELTHEDSMGNKETLSRGDIQYLSAGTGITHAEMNDSDEQVRLIQTWIIPQEKGLTPQYGSKRFDASQRYNKWLYLVGPKDSDAAIFIYQDASMFVSEIEANNTLTFTLKKGYQLYVKVMEGAGVINEHEFVHGDAAEVTQEDLSITATSKLHLLVVQLPC